MTPQRCDVAVVGSGFAGSLLARILAILGYDVVLIERGVHPRFAIGESTTPLANLSLERLARRYGLADCWQLAAHGRWIDHHPTLRRGLKRGFTFYRHHPGRPLDRSERLLVAASPTDAVADTHWLRADVDHHFVQQAVDAGVDYRDRVALTRADADGNGLLLTGTRNGEPLALHAGFVVDASGPNGFLARQLGLPSAIDQAETHSALIFSHFDGVRPTTDVVPEMPAGPYPDDWAAVHHIVDEGWMYALRFDDNVTSAGFLLTPRGVASVQTGDPATRWHTIVARYPTLAEAYADARPQMPIAFVPRVQHRVARAAGDRWVLLPHAFAFTDALFSTGIAWGLRAVERLALAFERGTPSRRPSPPDLARYDALLGAEATQIDRLVAGAYEAMSHFELFAAHAMLYFATVSYAEVGQRLTHHEDAAWNGFLGIGDPVLEPLPGEALQRLRRMSEPATAESRDAYVEWIRRAIAPRNVAGLADPARNHMYPVDLDLLVDRHALLGMSRAQLVGGLPSLRGMSPAPSFDRTALR